MKFHNDCHPRINLGNPCTHASLKIMLMHWMFCRDCLLINMLILLESIACSQLPAAWLLHLEWVKWVSLINCHFMPSYAAEFHYFWCILSLRTMLAVPVPACMTRWWMSTNLIKMGGVVVMATNYSSHNSIIILAQESKSNVVRSIVTVTYEGNVTYFFITSCELLVTRVKHLRKQLELRKNIKLHTRL